MMVVRLNNVAALRVGSELEVDSAAAFWAMCSYNPSTPGVGTLNEECG
jgi:hypothetical protein